jgi:hypothetical protein
MRNEEKRAEKLLVLLNARHFQEAFILAAGGGSLKWTCSGSLTHSFLTFDGTYHIQCDC